AGELENKEAQRKSAQAALLESEEKHRTLIETTRDLIYTTDNRGFLTYMNPTFEKTLGYTHNEWNGKTFAQIVAPECVDSVKGLFKKAMKGESIPVYETDLFRKGGTRLSVEFNVVTIYDSDGKPSGRYGIGRDITDRKRSERALRESENKYRLLADNINDVIFVLDMNLNYTYVSPSVKILRGYEPEELLKQPCTEALTPPSLDLAMRTVSEVMDLEKSEHRDISMSRMLQLEMRRKDGTTVWTEVKISFIRDENQRPVGILGLTRNISERKRVEEALKKSERNLSDIVEFLPDATFVIDLEGKVMAWNRAIEEMTGIRKEEMIGQGNHAYTIPFYGERRRQLLDLIDVSDKELESKYKSVQRKGNTLYAEAFAQALYGGKGAHFWATGAPLFDDSGNRVGAIESIRDITEYKKAEDEKRGLEERLNRAEKMEALGTLAGGVAHDLNNVLGIVVGYSEMLLDGVDKSSPIRHSLENVMNGGLRAAAIVDDLLTLARRGVSSRSILNLNKIVADCQQLPEFANLSSHHPSVKIKTDIDPDLLNISGSSVHLSKTLFNLVSNASESMAKGGDVTIKTTNQYLDTPIQGYDQILEGDYAVLSITDTGEGIHEDDLKRIFEPFYTKKVMGRSGTGLGLAVVWGTVKDHHGYINVQSESGKGSTFTLYFPVTREDITTKHVNIAISEYMGQGESVLVVDDVKEQRDLAAGMLRTLNYNVSSVSSGEEAVTYMKDQEVDLIVLDMIMDPGMDGLDTYR
ncbi:MAG: PAS domain S-box protein, partial [Syntrophus sp. (in: bacteria)]